jgi:CheY-like chemotaxis protein
MAGNIDIVMNEMTSNKFNVLVVDDEPDKRALLMFALQMADYEVRTASDGIEALDSIDSFHPDLIVTDVMMPRMDGFELARRIRANPATRYIPIIIQSAARSDAQDIRRGIDIGALSYITDPTDLDLLLARARTLLDFKHYLDLLEEAAFKAEEKLPEKTESQEIKARKRKALEIIKRKLADEDFDVFLCHNNKDKDAVKEIAIELQEHEILPWLDEWQLKPGVPWQDALEQRISKIKSAAVFVGSNGIGPWQKKELHAFLREFTDRGCPVIPVLLTNAPEKPALPNFLANMTWVDFRKSEPNPIAQLVWGITGKRMD